MKSQTPGNTAGNRLLELLPKNEYQELKAHLIRLALPAKQKLYEPNVPIRHVYFPIHGVMSMVTVMEDGSRTEVATVGNEGMIGVPVFLGADSIPIEAFAQVPGEAWRLETQVLKRQIQNGGRLESVLKLYTQALMNQLARSVSCNRAHGIEQRCCRWLLMTHDRVEKDEFPLTQEFLGQMLGVRRATVNEVAGKLQAEGLISYRRGIITVRNRRKLEQRACECYRIVQEQYERLLGRKWKRA